MILTVRKSPSSLTVCQSCRNTMPQKGRNGVFVVAGGLRHTTQILGICSLCVKELAQMLNIYLAEENL